MKWAGILLTGLVLPISAHHSFAAEYDSSKLVTLTGVVARLDWSNPHAQLDLEVKGERWQFELASPNALLRSGWTKTSVKPGDTVTITGFQARNGSQRVKAETVTLSNGRKLLVGTPEARPATPPKTPSFRGLLAR